MLYITICTNTLTLNLCIIILIHQPCNIIGKYHECNQNQISKATSPCYASSLFINNELKHEATFSKAFRPFTNLDEIDVILDDEYHPLNTINKVVLDAVPVSQEQIKISLAWLFEVENWDLDGMITINYPNTYNDDVERFVLASLKIENDVWFITVYDSEDSIMEFSFKPD